MTEQPPLALPGLTRRAFLARSLSRGVVLGCSAAASPLMTPVTLASAPGENRLVVIILRGGMDGLDVVRPVAERAFATLRPTLAAEPGPALDNAFALHPALSALMPLWQAGELGFVHATATPYRDKRSHFDGQDMLEAGTGMDVPVSAIRDGWLNRMLQAVPGVTARTAFAVGREDLLILDGDAPVSSWSPELGLHLSDQGRLLLGLLYADDPAFARASSVALDLAGGSIADLGPDMAGGEAGEIAATGRMVDDDGARMMAGNGGGTADTGTGRADRMGAGGTNMPDMKDLRQAAKRAARAGRAHALAAFAARELLQETRIAAFSLNGWDTHRNQARVLPRALAELEEAILTLRDGLGESWSRTTVLAMTEFGRTARENGSGGTDHGTGGAMVLAGGAVRGGRVHGNWPGLEEHALYQRRDLMPTSDIRAWAGSAMRALFGIERGVIERTIFPGLDMGDTPLLTR